MKDRAKLYYTLQIWKEGVLISGKIWQGRRNPKNEGGASLI
jgi:hypothetical protein